MRKFDTILVIDSKVELKKYFRSIYLIWLFIIPIITTFLSGYMFAKEGDTVFQTIQWSRVPSYFALWGIIFPITIVTAPAQLIAFEKVTGYTFFEAILAMSDDDARKMVIGTLLLAFAWIGPIVHLTINTLRHWKLIQKLEYEKPIEKKKDDSSKEKESEDDNSTGRTEESKTEKKEGAAKQTLKIQIKLKNQSQ